MVGRTELHWGFWILACPEMEVDVLECVGKLRKRHGSVRLSEGQSGMWDASWGVFRTSWVATVTPSLNLCFPEQAKQAMPKRALLAYPTVEQAASEWLLCSLNHLDNVKSCSTSVNYFLLTSAWFHWYVQSIISTARLLSYAAAGEHTEKCQLLK